MLNLVSDTPPLESRFSYPYAQLWFSIPLSRTLVFRTPCWNFVLLYHFKPRFLVQFPYPVSFSFSIRFDIFLFVEINSILMILNVYYIIQKIVKFLSEMSVFCQNLWYNVYGDISKGRYSRAWLWVLFLDYHFLLLLMVTPPLRPISRIGLFFLYQPRELSWTVHRLSNMFSILYDSLLFFQHK